MSVSYILPIIIIATPDTMTMFSAMPFSLFSSTMTMASNQGPKPVQTAKRCTALMQSSQTSQRLTQARYTLINQIMAKDESELQNTPPRQNRTLGNLVSTSTTDELAASSRRSKPGRKRQLQSDNEETDRQTTPRPATKVC